ncbi:EAL domain-containing protein [Rhizobium sp. KVB221]|uniref:EAL domain-containing protein n=1 Tax=Rhizobium setariae TaxID=2801340 RepID=A0A937CLS0_9HYPH|nr:EAL domain-containing protein [Rhizobium setariae]
MTHSVEGRFIAIILATLVLVVAPLFVLFLVLAQQQSADEALERGRIMIEANAQALGKPVWDFDIESVRQIARAASSSRSVARVDVRDNTGQIHIQLDERAMTERHGMIVLTRDIEYNTTDGPKKVGVLKLHLIKRPFFNNDNNTIAILAIFALAVLLIFAAAIIGNRQLVIKPLARLTAAIEATRRLGSRHKVDWHSRDEMGSLAANFNAMQTHLAEEEAKIKAAHERATEIYNRTPAMLYSVDGEDRLTAVSNYWLLATGYERNQVIGRIFADFVAEDDVSAYRFRHKPIDGPQGHNGITVRFCRADGELSDMLIMEAAIGPAGTRETLCVMADVTDLKAAEHRNHMQAITDHLTSLLNRQGFEQALTRKIEVADRDETGLACLFVDLDRFKWINDTLGHSAGDKVLQTVVARMRAQLRPGDTMARLGGDEFAILIAAPAPEKAALDVAERIARVIDAPMDIEGHRTNLSASVGIALYPQHAATAAELLQKSDLAMYARKRNGKNGARLFDPELANAAQDRVQIEGFITDGLREDWFDAHLQPIFDLRTGRIAGFEALMRLVHPEHGIIMPAGIVRNAEETGSIGQIGERIFEKAVSQLARLSQYPEFADAYVSVNISPLQFEPALLDRMGGSLLKWGVSPHRIVVEITEAVLMHHNPDVQKILETFGKSGFRLALDDFGTGYSSLSYLHKFPVDIVKIDQSFIRSLTEDGESARKRSRMLVEGITTISHQMNCLVVAEGIEKSEQRDILSVMGVDAGQGYHFSRALTSDDIIRQFASHESMPAQANRQAS